LSDSNKITLHSKKDVELNLQIVESGSGLVHVYDRDGKRIAFTQNSVVIPESVAKDCGIAVGQKIRITLDDHDYELTVTDISMQYATKTLYLTFDSAKSSGIEASADTMLIKLKDSAGTDDAVSKLSSREEVRNVSTKREIISRSRDMLKTLNATILLLLISAAVLAVTVIYNITSISIFERTREYATLMVLGYYKREVNRLTLMENLFLTGFGCLLGLPLGYVIFRYLVDVISRSNLRIPNGLDSRMVAVTIVLTFLSVVVSNVLLWPKIKKINVVEALKSVE
jgi:putative ABC transport system permease protein